MGSLEVIQEDKGGSGEIRMAGTITKIIIYSLLIVISIMLFTDFYVQGRRLWALTKVSKNSPSSTGGR